MVMFMHAYHNPVNSPGNSTISLTLCETQLSAEDCSLKKGQDSLSLLGHGVALQLHVMLVVYICGHFHFFDPGDIFGLFKNCPLMYIVSP